MGCRGLVFVLAVGCRSKASEPPPSPTPAPVAIVDATRATFARLPAATVERTRAAADGVIWTDSPRGELVGSLENTGAFACKLQALFGPPDEGLHVSRESTAVGWSLRHAKTGMFVLAYLGAGHDWGYGGAVVIRDDGSLQHDTEWAGAPPGFTAVVGELDDLLAATAPVDCEVTFSGGLLVNRAGVRAGVPFFRHLPIDAQLDYRLAELEANAHDASLEREGRRGELCRLAQEIWNSAKAQHVDLGARAPLRDHLRRCIEPMLAEVEGEVVKDWFDPGFVDTLDFLVENARSIDVHDFDQRFAIARTHIAHERKAH